MGECRLYKCVCGYEKELMTGTGLGAHSINVIRRCVPEDVSKRLIEEISAGNDPEYAITNSVIMCEGCMELNTVNDLTYTFNGKTLRYISDCPICGRKSEPLKDIEKIKCPKCGAVMKYSVSGFWD